MRLINSKLSVKVHVEVSDGVTRRSMELSNQCEEHIALTMIVALASGISVRIGDSLKGLDKHGEVKVEADTTTDEET